MPGCAVALCSSLFLMPGIHEVRIILLSENGMKQRGTLIRAARGIFRGRNPVLYLRDKGGREGGMETG